VPAANGSFTNLLGAHCPEEGAGGTPSGAGELTQPAQVIKICQAQLVDQVKPPGVAWRAGKRAASGLFDQQSPRRYKLPPFSQAEARQGAQEIGDSGLQSECSWQPDRKIEADQQTGVCPRFCFQAR